VPQIQMGVIRLNGDQMPPSLERCEPRHLKLDAVRDLQANRG
jgi:hypothetical protein